MSVDIDIDLLSIYRLLSHQKTAMFFGDVPLLPLIPS